MEPMFFRGKCPPQRLGWRASPSGTRDTFGIHGDILAGPRHRNGRHNKRTDGSHGWIGIFGGFQKITGDSTYPKMDGEKVKIMI